MRRDFIRPQGRRLGEEDRAKKTVNNTCSADTRAHPPLPSAASNGQIGDMNSTHPREGTSPGRVDREAADLDTESLVRRVTAFVGQGTGSFETLAREAFDFQYHRVAPFRRLCDHRGLTPQSLDPFDWTRIPAVPVMAFRRQKLHAAEPVEIFRSSGTTGGAQARSVHYHPFPDLYRRVIDATFPHACLPADCPPGRRPMLSLVPSRSTVPDSSLGFMCEHIVNRFATAGSVVAMGADGLDADAANTWVDGLRGRPGTILTTAFALSYWLDALEQAGLRKELPKGSTLFETGGFKGRARELERRELLERIERLLGLSPRTVVREYGMTELTGHFYTDVLHGGHPDRFVVPPFMRVRMLDPESLTEVPAGEPGLVSFFDLSNVGSILHVITQDLGISEPSGADTGTSEFWLLGRADDAQLRGCSLTAEELNSPNML